VVEQVTGNISIGLSRRMNEPGNIWLEAWIQIEAIPAGCQEQLFNENNEAEKVKKILYFCIMLISNSNLFII